MNPEYERGGPYSINCMRVTNAVELNMRGYQVVAGPHAYTVGRFHPDDELHYTIWRTAKRLDQKLRTTHFVATAWRAPDGQVRMPYAAKATTGAGGMNGQTLRDMTAHMPDGARGFAEGEWKGTRSGHIWNWVKEDGEIKWFEGQTPGGIINVDERLKKLKAGSLAMMRRDDLIPTDEVLAVISAD